MNDAEALFRQVVAAYAAEGFPHEIIGQWTLPENDVADLVRAIRAEAPRRVLEVGTFVGLSTMLIALAGGGRTRVVSIDPNFPIEIEMRCMGSPLGAIDATRPTQDIARAVAARLGIADRLDFVAGGFSSGATFAARRHAPQREVAVVGPEICAAHGPFDLAFIDGLHYADVVESDVALAARHLVPEGILLMHDCIGMWGSNVRAGIGRFLAARPEWRLLHPPYADLYRSIGMLFRPATRADLAAQLRAGPLLAPRTAALRTALATAVVRHTGVRRVIELHAGPPLLAAAFNELVDVETVPLSDKAAEAALGRVAAADPARTLIVSAGGPDILGDAAFRGLFAALARAGVPALILRTPPGEVGAACRFSRPLEAWVSEAARAGVALREWPPLALAPSTFLFRTGDEAEPVCSSLCSAVFAIPEGGGAARPAWSEALPLVTPLRAGIAEQQDLLEVHYANGFRSLFAHHAAALAGHASGDQTVAALSAQLARRDEAIAVLNAQLAERDETIAGLNARLVERDRTIAALSARPAADERGVLGGVIARLRGRVGAERPVDARASEAAMTAERSAAARTALIASALKHHRRARDGGPLGLLIDGAVTGEERQLWEALPSVACVWSRHDLERSRSEPAAEGAAEAGGAVVLPADCRSVYFVGPPRALTRRLLGEAWRHGVHDLHVAVAGRWVGLPLPALQRAHLLRARVLGRMVQLRNRLVRAAQRNGATALLPRQLAADKHSMDAAVAAMLAEARPRSDCVPGRIILVCGNLAPGGAERQVVNTLLGLADAGLRDISLLAHALNAGPARHDFHLGRLIEAGIPAREVERVIRDLRDPALPAELRRAASALPEALLVDIADLVLEFRRARPEIVHAWLDWDCVRAGLAAAIAGVPRIVLSGRNLAPYHFALYQPYMDPAYRGLAALANVHLLNNSRAGADDYAEWIGIARERIRVIHNGIATEGCEPLTEAERATERARYGLASADVVIGGVLRFAPEKQPLLWLDAAALVAARLPAARFVLFGQGALLPAMRERAARAGIADRVIFAGVTQDPLRAMGMMDVFLLTSSGEGLPNVLIEAQAMGTPVVCTRAGGAPEAVADGVTGTVVAERDAAAIAEAVLALAGDAEARARARREGPHFVRTRFGMRRMIAETIAAYGLQMPRRALPGYPPTRARDPADQPERALGAA